MGNGCFLQPARGCAATLSLLLILFSCGGGGSSPAPPQVRPPAATPTFWPVAGVYSPPQMVTLTDSTAGSTIYFTTDGTTPTTASTKYSSPIVVSAVTTIRAIATANGFSQSTVTSATYTISPVAGTGPAISIVLTTDDQKRLMEPQSNINFAATSIVGTPIIVDESETYQQVEGFGASFTDSAAFLLNQVATPAARNTAMSDLFTRTGKGIGISFIRNPMGASDIARSHYSYDDGPADPTLASFSIAHDQADIIPLTLQAKALNPQLKIMANPWSPPGWMKDSGSLTGGSLLPSMYDPFANYFVKYIQAYQAAGIPIDYISLQNEPLFVPGDYPGMGMDAATQTVVLRDHLLPALTANGITAKVLVYDHNWDRPDYPDTVISDSTVLGSSQVAGIAWHGYGGTPGVMTTLHNKYPSRGTYQTEHSGGTWVTDQVKSDFEEITQVMRNWGKSYVKWSLALDQNRGPHAGGCGTCSPLVTVNTNNGAVTYFIDFYTLGHFSKFVLPGATRVYSSNAVGVVSVAFLNPDASKVLVVFNDDANFKKSFQVKWGTQSFNYTLPPLAGATFTWSGTQSGACTIDASQIQASSYNATSGLQTEITTDTDGGYNLGAADDGDYAVYKNVDFGAGVTNLNARFACNQNSGGNCGGMLEFHLNSVAGPLIGSVTIPASGGWQTFNTTSALVTGASGVHDLYVVFKRPASGGTSLGNLNWFQFN